MRKSFGLLARLAVTGGCLTYAMWGVDFSRLFTVMRGFGLWALLACAAAVLVSLLPAGVRLAFLTQWRVRAVTGYRAVLLGLALNNILPARMGEAGKALYLTRARDVSMGRALEAVFWERFADLNALLALGAFAMAFMGEWGALAPLAGVVLGLWGFLLVHRLRPDAARRLLSLVPGQKLKLIFSEILLLLEDTLSVRFLFRLGLVTLAAWICYFSVYVFAVRYAAGVELSLVAIATVFAVTTMGFAVPAAPGGMGVYEAAFVLAMSWFGVGREEAFALGFALHMVQYVPVTLAGLGVMASGGFSLKSLRTAGAAQASPDPAGRTGRPLAP